MHVPSIICFKMGIYSIKYVVMLHIHTVLGSKIHPRELSYKRNQKVGETQFGIQLQLRIVGPMSLTFHNKVGLTDNMMHGIDPYLY